MINVELKVILIKITVFLPSGLGFLIIKKMFGSPPNAVLRGFHADMLSSQHIHCEVLTCILRISLNSSMAAENLYQGLASLIQSKTPHKKFFYLSPSCNDFVIHCINLFFPIKK
jgi:hypothetical protein